jgi:hypothetical protein
LKLEEALGKYSWWFRNVPGLARMAVHVTRKMYNAAVANGRDFGEECL